MMERRLVSKGIYHRLPEDLKSITEHFSGREKDIVLLSSIGVVSCCLPNVYGVYDGDAMYPHLYVIIIAPAASGKGVMNYSRLLIEPIHDKIFNDSKNEYLLCEESNKAKKKDKEICPPLESKIFPANSSSAEIYSYMGSSNYGLLIMESEADTMSQMLKNDWSNYSDVLRKAFHHEPISISRKMEKVFEDIKEPKLSMVISGTPDQLQPLIKSKENGLFSRFMVYNFDEISEFKDVFAKKNRANKIIFEQVGQDIFELYGRLTLLENPIEFTFTKRQQQKFLERIKPIRSDIIENFAEGFISNLHRHGLIWFRIAMILTALRNRHQINKLNQLVCSDVDFVIAMNLTKTLLRHSLFTFNTIDNGDLSLQDVQILDELNDIVFTRKDAIIVEKKLNIPKRTMDDKLSQWCKKKVIKRLSKGRYKRL